MSEVEKAYIAGILDGEGTITLTKKHKNQTPSPQISVSNNSLALLQWIQSKVGCGRMVPKKKRSEHHNQSYIWYLDNVQKGIAFLNEIKDFLRLKRRQAELIVDNYKRVTPRNGRYTKEGYQQKMALVGEIHKLNRQ